MRTNLTNQQRVALDIMTLVGPYETFTALHLAAGGIRVMRPGTESEQLVLLPLDEFCDLETQGIIVADARFSMPDKMTSYPSLFRLQSGSR